MLKRSVLTLATLGLALLSSAAVMAQEITLAPEFDNFVSTKSRAQVVVETQEAARRGLIPHNDFDHQRLATQGFVAQKTRAQVRAETIEAIRLGLLRYGEAGPPEATPQQIEQIRLAGVRALQVGSTLASK